MRIPSHISSAIGGAGKPDPVFSDDDALTGLNLAPLHTLDYKPEKQEAFLDELRRQRAAVHTVDGETLTTIAEDGTIRDGDGQLRFTEPAFTDLCNRFLVPSTFIRRYAKVNGQHALAILNDYINANRDEIDTGFRLVVDSEHRLVYGIVGAETYHPIDNLSVVENVMSTERNLFISRAYVEGPRMRFTALRTEGFEVPGTARKGDIIRIGYDADNSINGDSALRTSAYAERLVCTNGACRRDNEGSLILKHRNREMEETLAKNLIAVSKTLGWHIEAATAAASRILAPEELVMLRKFAQDGKILGPKKEAYAYNNALSEAIEDGRGEDGVSLWNYANGVTMLSHGQPSIRARTKLETVGAMIMRSLGEQFNLLN